MGITIKKAVKEDIPDMVILLGLLFSQEREFTPDNKKQQTALEKIITHCETGTIFVMRNNERIIGMVSLLYTISTALGGKAALLEDMIIIPEERGLGYGSLLLKECIAHASQEGCLRIQLLTDYDNVKAIGFYSKQRFVKSGMVAMRLIL